MSVALAVPDGELLLERAAEMRRILFGQDRDFLAIANDWQQSGRGFAGLVYAHQLAITVGQAINDLELLATVAEPEDLRDRIEFIPF